MVWLAATLLSLVSLRDADPVRILTAADAACHALTAARYHARHERAASAPGAPPLVREGDVTIAKWDRASRTDLPAQSKLNASVRMQLADGVVYTYDGTATRIVMPADKKVLIVAVGKMGEEFITGNVVGFLVETPLIEAHPFLDLTAEPARLAYVGTREIGGVPCDVIERRQDDDDLAKNFRTRWWIGIADHLPRGSETSGEWNGAPTSQSTLITQLALAPELQATTFAAQAPDGFAVEHYEPKKLPELLAAGSKAPAFTLVDAAGDPQSLGEMRGKIVVLDFWGTWCGPCLMAMPSIQKLHEQFVDRDVSIFGVSCREPEGADPAEVMMRRGFTYGLLVAGDPVAELYHVTSYPTFYVIGRDGTIVHAHTGYSTELESTIAAILERELKKR